MADLARHLAYLTDEWHAAQSAPLSLRKAMLVAALIDAYVDRLFQASDAADDILVFRSDMAAAVPALGQVFDLCSQRSRLVLDAVEIPTADYGALSVQDFMVSLYNNHSVQRLLIDTGKNERVSAHDVLAKAIGALSR